MNQGNTRESPEVTHTYSQWISKSCKYNGKEKDRLFYTYHWNEYSHAKNILVYILKYNIKINSKWVNRICLKCKIVKLLGDTIKENLRLSVRQRVFGMIPNPGIIK